MYRILLRMRICGLQREREGKSTQSYQEEMISLENKKLEWLIKHEKENDEDLNVFRSQVTYMKQLPSTKRVILEVTVPNLGGR
jgi:uncharacterized tellurite resistance protein B-like protein